MSKLISDKSTDEHFDLTFDLTSDEYAEEIEQILSDYDIEPDKVILIMEGFRDEDAQEEGDLNYISDVYTSAPVAKYGYEELVQDSLNSLKYRKDSAGENFILTGVSARIIK